MPAKVTSYEMKHQPPRGETIVVLDLGKDVRLNINPTGILLVGGRRREIHLTWDEVLAQFRPKRSS